MADIVDRLITKVELQGDAGVVRGLAGMGGAMKQFAALAAVGGVVDFLKSSVDAAIDAQRVAEQYAQTNKALGASYPVEEAAAYATQLERISVFSDEDILNAQRRLLELQLTRRQIRDILPQILDMASAWHAQGMSAEDAAEKIGRAFSSGNIAQLRRFGLVIDEALFKKDRLRALSEALDRFKGQTQALGGTAAGQLERLKNAVDDLQEALGNALLPVLKAVLPFLIKLTYWMTLIAAHPIFQVFRSLGLIATWLSGGQAAMDKMAKQVGAMVERASGNPPGKARATGAGGGFAEATRTFLGGGAIGRVGIGASELAGIRVRANNAPVTIRIENDDRLSDIINRALAELTRHGVIRPAALGY